ncbi:hypothetical protein K493DRAFT_317862 [Basidiobolus meristosporus CBS 931.73]|uniref:CigA protein n=1 Tax=Basidiobolus meristosporus CBS 931.73 TaxID=1314790 RepID=A0A1Y1XYL8_9FUNG|nr:hypothetical protein K493DRAFT_317862 [Basidiobolus meristosporus CBS 931.73]|eukprot:ORX90576.1 hypothetical protein K493DRAFT_317862 [Basidiobolus meristosporus CBS 931.73]
MFRFHKKILIATIIAFSFVVTVLRYKKSNFAPTFDNGLVSDFSFLFPPSPNSHQPNQAEEIPLHDNGSTPQGTSDLHDAQEDKQQERYLAYLPHSGFHNQRIALENAILLAKYLNRTLLIPPVYLGNAQAWKPFQELYTTLEKRTKPGMVACSKYEKLPVMKWPKQCALYAGWTMLPWSSIYSLNSLQGFIQYAEREDMGLDSLQDYGISLDEDIHFVKDTSLYDYRIFDHFPEGYVVGKYERKMMVTELQAIPHKLIHFGSIFGNLRVTTLMRSNKQLYQTILNNLQFNNPTLMRVSQRIVDQLGGLGGYLGIHLRVGDGGFSNKVEENAKGILQLMTRMLAMSKGVEYNEAIVDEVPIFTRRMSLAECLERDSEVAVSSPIVYLATDARDPRQRPDFSLIFQRFPCTFILSDFLSELTEIQAEKNPWDNTSIGKYLIPMVDAVVAAKGEFYVGTNQSTFSMYVRRMHNQYLGTADPLNLKY